MTDMPLFTVNGIVTRYADYKDYDRILTILTKELGLISAKSRGCRRPKSPLMSCSELFIYGEFVLFKSGDKYTLDSCDVRETFYPLREDIARFSAASYMLSIVNEGATEEELSDDMLSLLLYALTYTAHTDLDPADMAICFAARCLNLMGYRPAITNCAVCGVDLRQENQTGGIRFSGASGGALCKRCASALSLQADGRMISPLSMEALRRMLALRDADMKKVVLPEKVRNELKDAVNAYTEHILEKRLKPFDYI